MKSRINIDLDEDNQTIIEVFWRDSDDVRDKMVKKFLESFGSRSTLAEFHYTAGPEDGEAKAKIRPISTETFEEIVSPTNYGNENSLLS